jgi:hypothetical protein
VYFNLFFVLLLMNKKVYITGTDSDKKRLSDFIKTSADSKARQRAQAILWSMEGRDRKDLSQLFKVKVDTISDWFDRWQPDNLSTLSNAPRPGRPALLTEIEKKKF